MVVFLEEAGPLKDVVITVSINHLRVPLLVTEPWQGSKGKVRVVFLGDLGKVKVVNSAIIHEWLERHRVVNGELWRRCYQDPAIIC